MKNQIKSLFSFSIFANFFNYLNKKNKIIFLTCFTLVSILSLVQIYLIVHYSDELSVHAVIFSTLFLVACVLLGLCSLAKSMSCTKAVVDLEQEKLNNKTLKVLHDNTIAFKHDFANIMSAIGGYIETNDMPGLKNYYDELFQDCSQAKNLCLLSPEAINSPAIYILLANKYYKADSLGIKTYIECFIDFNNLYMQIYEFSRILGILLDNAIEAACECEDKIIKISILNEPNRNRQVLTIENTYKDKSIDLEKIYEKGFSTKKNNTGLGLWEVNKIIRKNSNLAHYSSKNSEFFKQQIEIYKK